MCDKNLVIGISLVLIWTCFDLKRSYCIPPKANLSEENSQFSTVSPVEIKSQTRSTIQIRYCQSSGYRNIFEQFTELVGTHYPNMTIVGENQSPSSLKALLARGLSIVKMTLLICLLFGQNPFPFLNIPTPRTYSWALRNKMYACLMIFFFSNTLESYLLSTGAFEISVDTVPLWSKLDAGRLPTTDEFIQMLQPFTN